MSYDLFFLRRKSDAPISSLEIQEYFLGRPNYKQGDGQIWYENGDTGVYFIFELGNPSEDEEYSDAEPIELPNDDLTETGLSFNLNYFRPHIFGLEAELEISALVSKFNLLVDDPQMEGMGRGEYTRDGFLKSWNTGNSFGHHACMTQMAEGETPLPPSPSHTLSAHELERLWAWNYHRNNLQNSIEVDAYVSLVRLILVNGNPASIVVWGDAIPEAFPKVDYLVLVRDKLGPRSFFKKKKDTCLVPFSAVESCLSLSEQRSDPSPYYLFHYSKPPSEIVDFFKAQKPFNGQLEGFSWDQVLTNEIVQEVNAKIESNIIVS